LREVEAAGLLDGGFGVCAFGGCTSVFLFLGKEGVFFSFLAGGLFFICGFGFFLRIRLCAFAPFVILYSSVFGSFRRRFLGCYLCFLESWAVSLEASSEDND